MTDDGIDKSQQLTYQQVHQYTEFRRKKGQVEYNEGSVLTTNHSTLDRLSREPDGNQFLIDQHQLAAGIELILLRMAALGHIDYATWGDVSVWFSRGEGVKHPETIYTRVTRRLGNHWKLMKELCFEPISPVRYADLKSSPAQVREALDATGDALQAEKERLKKEQEDDEGKPFEQICQERYRLFLVRSGL